MSSHKKLNEQVMVITGASSGIGLCTSLLAAERGAKLVISSRSDETLEKLVSEIRAKGGEAIYVVADVAEREQVEMIAQVAIQHYGCIDTWINDAGVSIYGRLDEVSEQDSKRLFETNFWGVVNGSLVALPHLKASGGALINVGSEVSEAVVPMQGMYSASKHAVKGFTDALRVEIESVDKSDMTITLIQPTAVNTPYPQHARNYMDKEPKLPTPMIEPQRVAEAILNAAVEGGRSVKVGAMAIINTTVSKLMPALGEKMAAMQADRQQEDRSPENPEGTLYEPGRTGYITGQAMH